MVKHAPEALENPNFPFRKIVLDFYKTYPYI